jgi:hypothetical protein
MSWPTPAAVASAAFLTLGLAAPHAVAKPATVTGKAPASAKVAGHSPGTVMAVGAATSRVLAARRLGSRGTYKLRVAPGPVVVLTPVVSRSGKVKVASSRVTRLKSGKRKRVRVTKTRPRPRRRRAAAAQAGSRSVRYSVYGSTVSGDAGALSGKSVDAMLSSDAWQAGARAPCPATQFADRRSDAFKAIQAEVALQNSPAFDPGSRITPKWDLPQNTPNTRINMQVSVAGDSATATITAHGKGKTVSRQVSGTISSLWFSDPPNAISQALDEIFEELCRGGLETIAGTFTGETTMPAGEHWRWNGSASFARQGPAEIPGANGNYLLTSGLVTYIASGRFPYAACQMSGNQQFNLQNGSIGVFGSPPEGLEPYTYGIDVGPMYPGTMEVTVSSCEPGAESLEGSRQTVPVGGPPLDPRETYQSDDGLVYDGTESRNEGGVATTYTWSLRGEPG